MKLNLKTNATGLDGKEMHDFDGKPVSLAHLLARDMFNSPNKPGSDSMKMHILSEKLFKDEVIEVDDSDLIKIKEFTSNTTNLTTGVVGAILKAIEAAKTKATVKDAGADKAPAKKAALKKVASKK